MSNTKYSAERNHQIVLALLKANNIRKVIVSPGATNVSLVAGMQQDSFFELYSVVDERSAAYFACGLSKESGEAVVLSCTGATSSRDYMPGLTEAFYSKLPILAITSSMTSSHIGHLFAQVTDRSNPPQDCVVESFELQPVKDADDEWDCTIKMNKAIQFLTTNGGGPVHINLPTTFSMDFSVESLPPVKRIIRTDVEDEFPVLEKGKKIAVFLGSHRDFSSKETEAIDLFCSTYDAVVLCDHTSGYKGRYRILSALLAAQEWMSKDIFNFDILIHAGDISADYYTIGAINAKEVWRLSEDGEIRDRFQRITRVFKMKDLTFFSHYADSITQPLTAQIDNFQDLDLSLRKQIPEIPFSNMWVARQIAPCIPANSGLHLGILQSIRSWNFYELLPSIGVYANVGGFGIDGTVSTLVGASMANPKKLYFGVVGDLSFFYDMNAIGIRHIGNNLRLMIINNGKGMEFRTYKHRASIFGEDTDKFIAASGHNGNQSPELVKGLAHSLGFQYLSAHNKEEFLSVKEQFTNPKIENKPIIFEVFTNTEEEVDSLRLLRQTVVDKSYMAKANAKAGLYNVLKPIVPLAKKILNK